MTAASLAHLPVAAGGAVLAAGGRATLWAAARYLRAPLANTAALAMVTLTAMAGSNALYLQQREHPHPMFVPTEQQTASLDREILPVIPATRRKTLDVVAPLPDETTGSVDAKVDADALGNAEVTEIQLKLASLELYGGSIDGLYGPRTARAIREFEERIGLPPKGELTRELLEAVRAAPVILPREVIDPLPTPDPLPEITVPSLDRKPAASAAPVVDALSVKEPEPSARMVEAALAGVDLEPLPEPEPLVVAIEAPTARLRRELPETPQEAMNIAVDAAGEAIETIVSGVQSFAMTTPPKRKAEPAPDEQAATDAIETASIDAPRIGVPLENPDAVVEEKPEQISVLDTDAKPEELLAPFSVTDPVIVAKVQRGLASLGFLHGPADGIAGEATAKAIRNFETYYNYEVTGRISPELLDLLVDNGASI